MASPSPASASLPGRALGAAAGLLLLLPLVAVAGCGGPDGIEGRVVAVDDAGMDDRPLGGGWVAVLEDDSLRQFLGEAGLDVPGNGDLPYVTGRVLRDGVTRAGGVLATIDE